MDDNRLAADRVVVALLAVDTAAPLAVGMPGIALEVEVLPEGSSGNGDKTIDYIVE